MEEDADKGVSHPVGVTLRPASFTMVAIFPEVMRISSSLTQARRDFELEAVAH